MNTTPIHYFEQQQRNLGARINKFNKVVWLNNGYPSFVQAGIEELAQKEVFYKKTNMLLRQSNSTAIYKQNSFNGQSLELLRSANNIPPYKKGGWVADIQEANNRISINNVFIKPDTSTNLHNQSVFSSVEFRNIVITLDIDGVKKKIGLDQDSANYISPDNVEIRREIGFSGMDIGSDSQDGYDYQAGLKYTIQYSILCSNTVIFLTIDYTFVFTYPLNDFEPTGLIDACKIFPQINFRSRQVTLKEYSDKSFSPSFTIIPPPGKNGNKIKIEKYNARVKLNCNNNSSHHITAQDGYDINYFPKLRSSGNLPDMFERKFKPELLNSNIVGLYSDSNYGTTNTDGSDDKKRDRPKYKFKILPGKWSQPSPFWGNIFDYSKYNLKNEIEFIAVYGTQSNRYQNYKFSDTMGERKSTHDYPIGQSQNKISIQKERRQGAYDNIHLHGYLGHYKDNDQLVIHAPICGYCCFHMHWRWSGLNADISANPAIRLGNNGFTAAINATGRSFKGWDDFHTEGVFQVPNESKGLSLIPFEQQLKIAITHTNINPKDEENNVTPTTNTILESNNKAFWYCVDIINTENEMFNSHLVLEQGCGYAYDYSKDAKKLVEKSIIQTTINNTTVSIKLRFLASLFRKILEENESLNAADPIFLDYICRGIVNKDSDLTTQELFEIQYRLMRLFNEIDSTKPAGRNFLNQIPAINDNPTVGGVIDKNTREYLQNIFDSIVNQ